MSETAGGVGLRERKKLATRRAIHDAAWHVTLRDGYDRLTVELIAGEIDISPRTFFNYFSSKDEALFAPDPERVGWAASVLRTRPAGEPVTASLRAVCVALAESFEEHDEHWHQRIRVINEHPHLLGRQVSAFSTFERSLADAIGERTGTDPATDLFPGLAAACAVGALRVAVAHWRTTGRTARLSTLVGEAFDLLTAGLTAPAPITGDPQ